MSVIWLLASYYTSTGDAVPKITTRDQYTMEVSPGESLSPGDMVQIRDDGLAYKATSTYYGNVIGYVTPYQGGTASLTDVSSEPAWFKCIDAVSSTDVGKHVFVSSSTTVTKTNNGIPAGVVMSVHAGGYFIKFLSASNIYTDYTLIDDIIGSSISASGVAALENDAIMSGASGTIPCFRHDQDDVMIFYFQLPHRYKPNSKLHFHLHAICYGSVTGNVRLRLRHTTIPIDAIVPAYASWSEILVNHTIAGTDQYKCKLLNGFEFTPVACESSIVVCEIARLGTDPLDTYTSSKAWAVAQANIGILYGDIHYQSHKMGTYSHGCTE